MSPIYVGFGHGALVLPSPGGAPELGIRLPPLSVSTDGRMLQTSAGAGVLLGGLHTWANLVDQWGPDAAGPAGVPHFDFDAYVAYLQAMGHNVTRVWSWEQARYTGNATDAWFLEPLPYSRTGGGSVIDGGQRFDVSAPNPAYLERLRARCIQLGQAGIYSVVQLFDDWGVGTKSGAANSDPWLAHPFNPANNINGVDGDPNHTGGGHETLNQDTTQAILGLRRAFVEAVIDAVQDIPSVLGFEIVNENQGSGAVAWQEGIRAWGNDYIAARGYRSLLWLISVPWPGGVNTDLLASTADLVALNAETTLDPSDPFAADGQKVYVDDSDHIWGIGGDRWWAWHTVLRGRNILYMDPWDANTALGSWVSAIGDTREDAASEEYHIRQSIGQAVGYANRLRLAAVHVQASGDGAPCSTRYCLWVPGEAYLCYHDAGGSFALDLSAESGSWRVEWFDPDHDAVVAGGSASVEGGASRTLSPPFTGRHCVAYLAPN